MLTVMTYMGSSVYTMGLAGEDSVTSVFQVEQTIAVCAATFPLARLPVGAHDQRAYILDWV